MRRRHLLRRLTRQKISPRYQTLSTEGAPGPPEASDVRGDDYGGPCAVSDGAERRPLSKVIGQLFDSLKPIYVCSYARDARLRPRPARRLPQGVLGQPQC